MTKDELITIGLSEEQVKEVLAIRGKEIERFKEENGRLRTDNETLKAQISAREKDMENLKASREDAETLRAQIKEMQEKYSTESESFQKQLRERDYTEAVKAAIEEKNIKFSSKSAQKAYMSELARNPLPFENGKLLGFEEYHKAQLEGDPAAFAEDKADKPPLFSVGAQKVQGPLITADVAMAATLGKEKAESLKNSQSVLKYYAGRNE